MIDTRTEFYLQLLSIKPSLPSEMSGGGRPHPAAGVLNAPQSINAALGIISKRCRIGATLLHAVYLGGYTPRTVTEIAQWLVGQPQMLDIGPKLLTLEKAKASPFDFGLKFRAALAELLLSEVCHLAGAHYCGYCKGRKNDCEHCQGEGVVSNTAYGERRRVERLGLHSEGITRHFWRNHLHAEYDAILNVILGQLSSAASALHRTLKGEAETPVASDHAPAQPLHAYNRWPTKQWFSGHAPE